MNRRHVIPMMSLALLAHASAPIPKVELSGPRKLPQPWKKNRRRKFKGYKRK
jgi:hypothetical protein